MTIDGNILGKHEYMTTFISNYMIS